MYIKTEGDMKKEKIEGMQKEKIEKMKKEMIEYIEEYFDLFKFKRN